MYFGFRKYAYTYTYIYININFSSVKFMNYDFNTFEYNK